MVEPAQTGEREESVAWGDSFEPPTLRRLLRAHPWVAAAVFGILVLLVALALVSDLGSRGTRIGDSTPCSVWSSSNQGLRDAFAARYVKEHGPRPSGASDAGTIEGVIDDGCTRAYGFDEADTVTVLQAIRHQY
ncbi:MAG: hypothetical protein M3Z84_09225 [Actinomycetota bacterium]|nr:hypothetical protein [Actinomycetota bacterium]